MDCSSGCPTTRGTWSIPEHERFIEAMSLYPRGPWKLITAYVGSRSIKQVQTHAQKYQQKLLRQQRGLRKRKINVKRPEHRVDPSTLDQFTHKCIVRYAQRLGKEQNHGLARAYGSSGSSSPVSPSHSSAASSPTAADVSPPVEASLVGTTLSEWLAMTKDAAADAKLLELLPEVFPGNEDDENDGDRFLKIEPLPQDWSALPFNTLLRPTVDHPPIKSENGGFVFEVADGAPRKCVV